jgi:hypothetical protein
MPVMRRFEMGVRRLVNVHEIRELRQNLRWNSREWIRGLVSTSRIRVS